MSDDTGRGTGKRHGMQALLDTLERIDRQRATYTARMEHIKALFATVKALSHFAAGEYQEGAEETVEAERCIKRQLDAERRSKGLPLREHTAADLRGALVRPEVDDV